MTDAERIARLQRTLDYGGNTHSIADVVQLVRDGKAQWWNNGDGSIVTEILEFPQYKAVNFWLLTGHLPDVLALDPEITAWAKTQDCKVAIAAGRRGWGRVGARYGWRHRMEMFWKELQP